MHTLKTLAMVGTLMALMLGIGGAVVADLATVKQSIDAVAQHQATPAVELAGPAPASLARVASASTGGVSR